MCVCAGEATAGLAKRGTQRARARAHSEAEAAAQPRHARCSGKPDNDGVGLQAKTRRQRVGMVKGEVWRGGGRTWRVRAHGHGEGRGGAERGGAG